jgi:EAL domain-containing protein (putative c-di-GMP-specific phosphodiesterase class I)/FixJ family two-component response regulator
MSTATSTPSDRRGAIGPSRTDPRILLVDDDPFMLALQSRMLRGMGYRHVRTAEGALAALTTLQQRTNQADIVICDLKMPGMDGVEFLQRLNAGIFTGSVILLSGEGARIMHTVRKLLSGGCMTILGALEKPAKPESLRELIDCWTIDSATPTTPAPRPVTAAELRAATDRGEWVLHYQPKVDLQTGALTGSEALIRWNHPVHGLLFPDSFIAAAEDFGAIDDITDWVMREATAQLARWTSADLLHGVAINLSMDNLRAPDFARRADDIVRDAGVSPQDVTFEITESRAMSPSPEPLESLVRLRLQRFKLSIDDFGTGHSSLAQLRDVPFTELKIDRGFVHGARSNQIIRPILEGSIGIAKRLGMLCVAEGIETEQDWQLLRELGCDVAQGYFISRPMSAARFPEWVVAWEGRRPGLCP